MGEILLRLFIFLLLVRFSKSSSLLSRFFQEQDGDPIQENDSDEEDDDDDDRVSDADVGMKSDRFIGTIGNRRIETRQQNTFIDQDGVPVPMLPYERDVSKLNHEVSLRQRFVQRARYSNPSRK